jgi:hypothetical protein
MILVKVTAKSAEEDGAMVKGRLARETVSRNSTDRGKKEDRGHVENLGP